MGKSIGDDLRLQSVSAVSKCALFVIKTDGEIFFFFSFFNNRNDQHLTWLGFTIFSSGSSHSLHGKSMCACIFL